MANSIYKKIHDWYVTGPRHFSSKQIYKVKQMLTREIAMPEDEIMYDHYGILELNALKSRNPELDTLDGRVLEATRRRFDKAAKGS
ncbi:hypothetical protein J4409_03230 [Candidatus Woesearchaeota archaeon]|nr:hypothetical protein [Candidatus Woesearchaeota archaeon]